MKHITALRTIVLLLVAGVSPTIADSTSAQINGIEIGKTQKPAEKEPKSRAQCVSHCNAANSKCNSEVRKARQECSRNAANSGRDPFTGRNAGDYTYFCGHFNNARRCSSNTYTPGCESRYARRYGLCVDAMQNNIASMRYDCYKAERDTQNQCRDELRDCQKVCETEADSG